MQLQDLISKIQPLDEHAMDLARRRQDDLTKPRGSLGRLEDLSCQLSGIAGRITPQIHHKAIIVMAGDHGVVTEGVSAYPSEVTAQMVSNFLAGGAAINVLARQVGARVVIVDMGVASTLPAHPDLISHKIAPGTGNISRGPAMTRQQAIQSILAGAFVLQGELTRGLDLVATGDMGIGNTTPSATIATCLTSQPARNFIGSGAGVDDQGLNRKLSAVQHALEINQPDPLDGLDVLAKVGGFEIGGLVGVILASAANRLPVLVDGFISTAAAMLAASLAPRARGYMIAAHRSQEQGHDLMLEWLQLTPLLDLRMRLGEGTGAALAMPMVEASARILTEMATFSQAGVSDKV